MPGATSVSRRGPPCRPVVDAQGGSFVIAVDGRRTTAPVDAAFKERWKAASPGNAAPP